MMNQEDKKYLLGTVAVAIAAVAIMLFIQGIDSNTLDASATGQAALQTQQANALKDLRPVVEGCFETDDGDDEFTFGQVRFQGTLYEDYCTENELNLYEYSCAKDEDNNPVVLEIVHNCVCSDGECEYSIQTEEEPTFQAARETLPIIEFETNPTYEQARDTPILDERVRDSLQTEELVEQESKIESTGKIDTGLGSIRDAVEEDKPQSRIDVGTCQDIDGLDYGTQSHVRFYDETNSLQMYEDQCIEQTDILYEWYCDENEMPQFVAVDCAFSCSQGACPDGSTSGELDASEAIEASSPDFSEAAAIQTCYETDAQNDPYNRGELKILPDKPDPIYDWCNSAGRLIEYYCADPTATEWSFEVYDCEFGCDQGVCLTS